MRLRKRGFLLRLLLVIVTVILLLMIIFRVCAGPVIQELATSSVCNHASAVINDAIEAQMMNDEVDYDSIVLLEKDASGKITAIRTNISEVNRLKTQILSQIDRMLLDLDVNRIGIPLGNLVFPQLFSGTGPRVPVKVVSVSNSDAEFRNIFSEAGINQTTHQIMLDVTITMTVLTPVGTHSVQAISAVMVAETIIVGNVPNSYIDYQ